MDDGGGGVLDRCYVIYYRGIADSEVAVDVVGVAVVVVAATVAVVENWLIDDELPLIVHAEALG